MAFEDEYEALEEEFRRQVESDNGHFEPETKSVYLPNIRPEGPVDFVFVGMEPSLGGWAWDTTEKSAMQMAEGKIRQGFKNFALTLEDFIFHHCIREYLCERDRTYYITDLSKGAMLTKLADDKRKERYEKWFPLLERELNLVAKEIPASGRRTQVIAVGKSQVGKFLSKKQLPNCVCYAGAILHYSKVANVYRGTQKKMYPEQYSEFALSVTLKDITQTAEIVMREGGMGTFVDCTLKKLEKKSDLTDSLKKLMFDYKIWFEDIREGRPLPS